MFNTGYVEILNTLRKIYTSINLNLKWLQGYDRYFKEVISQSPVIVCYDNYNKLTSKQKTQVVIYIKDYEYKYYRLDVFL